MGRPPDNYGQPGVEGVGWFGPPSGVPGSTAILAQDLGRGVSGQPRVSWISRGWGTLSGPGAGDAAPASVLAPLPPQHFLIPAPNNNSHSCSHSDRPRPRPGSGLAARDADAGVAPSAPGVRRDDVYSVVSKALMPRPQCSPCLVCNVPLSPWQRQAAKHRAPATGF